MSDAEQERDPDAPDASGEESIDDSGRNPTQKAIDEAGDRDSDEPVDAPWGSEDNESL